MATAQFVTIWLVVQHTRLRAFAPDAVDVRQHRVAPQLGLLQAAGDSARCRGHHAVCDLRRARRDAAQPDACTGTEKTWKEQQRYTPGAGMVSDQKPSGKHQQQWVRPGWLEGIRMGSDTGMIWKLPVSEIYSESRCTWKKLEDE